MIMKTISCLLSVALLLTACWQRTSPPAPVSYGYHEPSAATSSQSEVISPSPVIEVTRQSIIEQKTIQQEEIPAVKESLVQPQHEEPQKKTRSSDKPSPRIISEENNDHDIAPFQKPKRKKLSAAEREKELEVQFSSLEEPALPTNSSKIKEDAAVKKTSAFLEKDSEKSRKNTGDFSQEESSSPSKKETTVATSEEADQPRKSVSKFSWPVKGEIIGHFSQEKGKVKNDGINIAAPKGTPIVAVEDGIVVYEGNEMQGFGNLTLLKHPGGWMSAYGHCSKIFVKRGQKVQKGDRIALVGDTGSARSPQLHFQLRKKSTVVDPLQYLE
jgi:murein DD-endopeptidase MepM/ murein hydrolase activator NlpD